MVRQGILALALALVAAAPAAAAPEWAPVDEATIHPGTVVTSPTGSCTTNFVFYDATDVYIGTAAHCAQEDTDAPVGLDDGCGGVSLPLGTDMALEGADQPGRLAYSSWLTMAAVGEKDRDTCGGNDFALVLVDPEDAAKVNPSVPVWGGPDGLRIEAIRPQETMVSYGRSSLHLGVEALYPREGRVETAGDWTFAGHYLTPGVFGDSGSAVLDGAGGAVGDLVTLTTFPPAGNGTTRLIRALEYMRRHTPIRARLAEGTERFRGADLPALVASPDPRPDPQPEPEPAPPPAAAPPARPAAARPAPTARPRGRVTRAEQRRCARKRTRKARRACLRRARRS